MGLFEGSQEEQASNRGRLSAAFGGMLFFVLSLFLMTWQVEDMTRDERSMRWTIFAVLTVLMFVISVIYVWRHTPDVMPEDPGLPKGWFWMGATGAGISVTIRRIAPDLIIGFFALGAGIALTAVVAPILILFIRPRFRKGASVKG